MIQLDKNTFVDPAQVTALQYENVNGTTLSGGYISGGFSGTIITLKCGRKIAVRDQVPNEIHAKLWPVSPDAKGQG